MEVEDIRPSLAGDIGFERSFYSRRPFEDRYINACIYPPEVEIEGRLHCRSVRLGPPLCRPDSHIRTRRTDRIKGLPFDSRTTSCNAAGMHKIIHMLQRFTKCLGMLLELRWAR